MYICIQSIGNRGGNLPKTPDVPNANPVRRTWKVKYSSFLERVKEYLDIEDIEPNLTQENYREKFHKLLCWEESEHITLLHERYMYV